MKVLDPQGSVMRPIIHRAVINASYNALSTKNYPRSIYCSLIMITGDPPRRDDGNAAMALLSFCYINTSL